MKTRSAISRFHKSSVKHCKDNVSFCSFVANAPKEKEKEAERDVKIRIICTVVV